MRLPNPKLKAFCFLVSDEGRDFYLLIAFIHYLEQYMNFEVTIEFVWDAHKIRSQKPDLVILPNSRGNHLYYQIAHYATKNGILVFCHDSEGNFATENFDYWAFNLDKKSHSPIIYAWNERIKKYFIETLKLPESKVYVSGGPGFDKYQYLQTLSRSTVLKKYGKEGFQKVVGYAGWAFGKANPSELEAIYEYLNMPGEIGRNWMKENRLGVEAMLRAMIEKHEDVLFILKKHPRENYESEKIESVNEMNQLVHFSNVLYLKDEEEIQNLIGISDLWTAFESTSIMEAWMMGTPTLMLNPTTEFKRAELYKGVKIVRNVSDSLNAMEALINGNSSYFEPEEIIANRNRLIADSAGFVDGMNHLRCAKVFAPFIEKIEKTKRPSFHLIFFLRYLALHIGKYFYVESIFNRIPKLRKAMWIIENHRLLIVKKQKETVKKYLHDFYLKKGIDTADKMKEYISNL